jgi:hypothetical protein
MGHRDYDDTDQHFVLAFHDSTFECVARGYDVELHRGPLRDAVASVVSRLG